MTTATRPPANGFVRVARKVYNPLHFTRGYNFVLFFIFAGAMLGFALARFMYLDFDNIFCNSFHQGGAAPGECYYYTGEGGERYKIGILMHLGAVLPAGFLACFQFVPVIRHKVLLFHRVNGYVILALALVSSAGVLMIVDRAFGGGLMLQTASGLLAIMFVGSLTMAYINIKRLQIEQHRAWMLRAWFYAGTIITVRIMMIISAVIMSTMGGFFDARRCADIDYMFFHFQNYTTAFYPECTGYYSGDPDQYTVVSANIGGDPAQVSTALGLSFGMSFWLALAIHTFGVETYLRLTPKETERLRNVSYQRQVEAGMKRPGNAGLTVEKLGDADPWVPESVRSQFAMEIDSAGEQRKIVAEPAQTVWGPARTGGY